MKSVQALQKLGLRMEELFILIQILRKIRYWNDNMRDKGFPGYNASEVYHLVMEALAGVNSHIQGIGLKGFTWMDDNPEHGPALLNSLWQQLPDIEAHADIANSCVKHACDELKPLA